MVTDMVNGKFWEVWKRLVVCKAPGYGQYCNDGFKLD